MSLSISPAPYTHQARSVSQIMREVLFALIPGIILYVWFFGWGVVVHLVLAGITALATEALMLKLRHRPIKIFLQDYSALVTACLLALAIPPLAPWWVTVIGTAFALIFAKHLYGGLGVNTFNPAMVAYAMLLISFPVQMTHWPALSALSGYYLNPVDAFNLVIFNQLPVNISVDALSGATPLETIKTALNQSYMLSEVRQNPIFGDFGARGWEWMANAFLLGGIWLIYRKIITWHIPVAVLGSLATCALLFYAIDPDKYPSPLFHIFSGAAMLGAFFIATDPVSAATSLRGKLVYGIGIGVLIYTIRAWGGYPDAVAFAVLLMNLSVPFIDYYTKPPAFGTQTTTTADSQTQQRKK
jgi:electron transport complex protein RnfD